MAPANAIQPARYWRLVITRLPSLLAISLLLSLYAPLRAQTPPPVDGGWPRDSDDAERRSPHHLSATDCELDRQSDLVAYAAVSYTPAACRKRPATAVNLTRTAGHERRKTRQQKQRNNDGDEATKHSDSLGRRHRLLEHQPLQQGHDGIPDAQHRPRRQGRRHVHRLVRAAELHRRPRRVHHRPESRSAPA